MTLWDAFTLLAVLWLFRIAWVDFWTLRIANIEVIGLSLLLGVGLLASQGMAGGWDFAAGLLLFAVGFGCWAAGLMGGGDAKLFLPIGLLIGWDGLIWFAVFLAPAALATLIIFWIVGRLARGGSRLARRLEEIRVVRGLPYAVPILVAAVAALSVG